MAEDENIAKIIRETDALLREHAATPSQLEQVLSKPLAPSVEAMQKSAATVEKLKLPQGIRGCTIAGIVAGVAVTGGAIYMATHRKKDAASWADRVQAERAMQASNGRSF